MVEAKQQGSMILLATLVQTKADQNVMHRIKYRKQTLLTNLTVKNMMINTILKCQILLTFYHIATQIYCHQNIIFQIQAECGLAQLVSTPRLLKFN
jgi:hypothetical protein